MLGRRLVSREEKGFVPQAPAGTCLRRGKPLVLRKAGLGSPGFRRGGVGHVPPLRCLFPGDERFPSFPLWIDYQ